MEGTDIVVETEGIKWEESGYQNGVSIYGKKSREVEIKDKEIAIKEIEKLKEIDVKHMREYLRIFIYIITLKNL